MPSEHSQNAACLRASTDKTKLNTRNASEKERKNDLNKYFSSPFAHSISSKLTKKFGSTEIEVLISKSNKTKVSFLMRKILIGMRRFGASEVCYCPQ